VAQLVSEGLDIRLLLIDVADAASVSAAAARVAIADGKLDVLINNAGILCDGASSPLTQAIDDVRQVYETNVFGIMRTTQAFVPLLKNAWQASVVNVSSGLGTLGWMSDMNNSYAEINILGYNTSKSAVNALTVAFSKALRPFDITVNATDPGYTATDFNAHSGPRSVQEAAAGIVWLARQPAPAPRGQYFFGQESVPW
jgi:NAD(P)-dependent dehydrogenase (short-subunit alcohol dehydrogenase family)